MSALPPEAAVGVILGTRSAYDPKQTFARLRAYAAIKDFAMGLDSVELVMHIEEEFDLVRLITCLSFLISRQYRACK